MYETPRRNDRAGGEQHVDCLEAREQFPAMVDGTIGLSEWAPVEAHVGKCVNCRKLLDRLYSMKPRNEPEWARASTRPVEPPDESTRILEVVEPRRSPPRTLWVSIVAVALMLGAAWGIVAYGSRVNLGSSLAALLQKVRPESRQTDIASAPPQPAPAPEVIPPSSTPPLELAPATPAPPVSLPEPKITAPAKAVPARPPAPPSPPVSAPEPKITASAKAGPPAPPSPPASLPSRVNKPPRPTPSNEPPTAKPNPEPTIDPSALVEAGKIDVAVQLSVRNRKDAERDLGMLLTRVGGTKFGTGQASTLMASVPRSSYSEFTRGLTQIGSWQLEAGRSTLPDPVHIAVKLAK